MTKSLSVRLEDMIASLGDREEFVADGFENGSLRVLLYVPRGSDPQQPHEQDEVYVVVRGSGTLSVEDGRREFSEGDVLFVAAGAEHRFEDFTDDFTTWAIFYGPKGGEAQLPASSPSETDRGRINVRGTGV